MNAVLPDPALLIISAMVLAALSGVPGLLTRFRGGPGQRISILLLVGGNCLGLGGALALLIGGTTTAYRIDWPLPFGPADIAVDPISAFFLLPVFLISACASVYAAEYRPGDRHPGSEPKLTLFTGFLTASMIGILLARNGAFFLIAWEIMALSCYFLMSVDDDKAAVREAATFYLITTHLGTLGLFALFSLLNSASGSFVFPLAGTLDAHLPLATAIFATSLFGFGLKAGIMPLHVWLPSAHANAPSHISAMMSGLLIKMGIYGLVRILSFFTHIPLWWGVTLLVAGMVSGIVGVVFAIGQHDLKRLLAYHSIENIGIITMGLGTAVIGCTIGKPPLVVLGLAGALLHVLNHAIFKGLLFLAAGATIHSSGTREIDQMGGLAKTTPWTAFFFLTGAVAICGLPPLNGFVSELLVYLGLFRGILTADGTTVAVLALAVPALGLIGGLAAACFVKVYGAVFLGHPRTTRTTGHEAGWRMRGPMGLLAACCAVIGCLPMLMAPLLNNAVHSWQPAASAGSLGVLALAPLPWITPMALILLVVGLLLWQHFRRTLTRTVPGSTVTWDCGYAAGTRRMQYSSSSFAEMLVKLFSGILRPEVHPPTLKGNFPSATSFASHVPEVVLECVFIPLFTGANRRLSLLRRLQHGQLHLYILYTFITLVVLLIWANY